MRAKVKVVVAVDFGTHASGYNWTVVNSAHDDPAQRKIFMCDDWAGQPIPYPKTLSALILDPEGQVFKWGWEAHREWCMRGVHLFREGYRLKKHFKMSLARSADEKPGRKGMALDDAEEDPRPLIVAYLRKLYERALAELATHRYEPGEIRWCLTVPAIWDDYQKQVMRAAAHEAGMPSEEGRLILALEPEAAAHYARVAGVRSAASDADGCLTAPGACYMVVDCGGGTVDITGYRNNEAGLMVEIGRVYGDRCGSTYLNKAFEEAVLTKRLGGVEEMDRLQSVCPAALGEMLDEWERVKLSAEVGIDQPLYLHISAALDRCLTDEARTRLADFQDGIDDYIVVTPDEVRDIFEHVVPKVLRLIDEQLDEMIESGHEPTTTPVILLAGGFAASPYLRQRVEQHLAGKAEVRRVPNPSVAVLAGGVHFAYEPQTRVRRSKFTYGINLSRKFQDGIDPPENLYVSKAGYRYCRRTFDALVAAGESIRTDQEASRVYIPLESDLTAMRLNFFATRDPHPRYISDPGCEPIGSLKVDLAKVMHLPWKEREVRVAMKLGETEIAVRVTLDGTDVELSTKLEFTAR